MQPLSGIRVLDLTTLVPGPLATLALAEAGADVLKVERPGGDEARQYEPKSGADSGVFIQLNRGKLSVVLDLKTADGLARFKDFASSADVLVEQFRPGVMDRLGLGYDTLRQINPRLIYCAISGYGQTGPSRNIAAHDLNYVGETGMLSLVQDTGGVPVLPTALIADIGGGSYPAIINILLALLLREKTGQGSYLDIAMAENVFPFLYSALAQQQITGGGPRPSAEMTTGGTPRYRIYQTADDRFLTVAPVEDRFWVNFCQAINLPEKLRPDDADPATVFAEVAATLRQKTAAQWSDVFSKLDVCVSVAATIEEAMASDQFMARGIFGRSTTTDEGRLLALPVPIVDRFRAAAKEASYPRLVAQAGRDWPVFP